MDIVLAFELVMQSDYHVGSGQRAGPLVDSALLRDFEGVPALRGTMLAGLLRDGFCDLCEHIDSLAPSRKQDTACAEQRLFGDATKRKRWTFSSARPTEGERSDERWGAQDVTRVRVSPRTRRAEEHKLFAEEEGAAQLAFRFTVTRHHANAEDLQDAYLLIAAARMVRHIGAARRRGRGECVVNLKDAQGLDALKNHDTLLDDALAKFQELWLGASSSSAMTESLTSNGSLATKGDAKRFRVFGYALEPLLMARRSEAGNAYESLEQISGAAILGALATRAQDAVRLKDENTFRDFVTLFFRGGVRVTGLYPAKRDGYRLNVALPTPKTLLTCENFPADRTKRTRHPFFNLAAQRSEKCSEEADADLQGRDGFTLLERCFSRYEPQAREEAHIQMNRANERVKTGDLFEYITLEAGQWFVGEIEAANQDCWNLLRAWTDWTDAQEFVVRVGKASQRGYGALKLKLEEMDAADAADWTALDLKTRVAAIPETDSVKLSLYLLTDAIITDTWERVYAGFDARWIATLLGVASKEIHLLENVASVKSVDSFNSTRRMPRWRDEAITAGSAAGFTITKEGVDAIFDAWRKRANHSPNENDSRLDALLWRLGEIERAGIGLRTNEGFGRVAFNHPFAPPYEASFKKRPELGDVFIRLGDWVDTFVPHPGIHSLQELQAFRERWQTFLDDSQASDKRWRNVKAEFESVARLLFSSASQSDAEVTRRMGLLGKPEYLWAEDHDGSKGALKSMARSKEGKLDTKGLELVDALLKELKAQAKDDLGKWRVGMNDLAARIGVAAKTDAATQEVNA